MGQSQLYPHPKSFNCCNITIDFFNKIEIKQNRKEHAGVNTPKKKKKKELIGLKHITLITFYIYTLAAPFDILSFCTSFHGILFRTYIC